jgi:hypothetical protein
MHCQHTKQKNTVSQTAQEQDATKKEFQSVYQPDLRRNRAVELANVQVFCNNTDTKSSEP